MVFAGASAHKQAHVGALTAAIEEFASTGADDDTQPYLDYYELLIKLNTALKGQRWRRFGAEPGESDRRLVFLPNRHYRPAAREQVPLDAARQDMAVLAVDMAAHWDPRSRGVSDTTTAGVYFTGREALMAKLVDAVHGPPGALVVTGTAGCGKSAVLSRLVTLSDPRFRERYAAELDHIEPALRPDLGDVDVAVLASGKVAVSVLDQIRAGLGVDEAPGEARADTVRRIHQARAGQPPATVVLDALDEAHDPAGIVREVLTPLTRDSATPWLRLLVGCVARLVPQTHRIRRWQRQRLTRFTLKLFPPTSRRTGPPPTSPTTSPYYSAPPRPEDRPRTQKGRPSRSAR
jgi:hypothetical protein